MTPTTEAGGRRTRAAAPPTLLIPEVSHVGDLDPASKRKDSYEGRGLSVCLHPAAWRHISDGVVHGPTHSLTHPVGAFLDARSLKPAQRREVLAWAVARGLAEKAVLWTVSWTDEDEERRTMTVETRAEALAEAAVYDEDDVTVRRRPGHVSTPALDALAMQTRKSLGDADVLDMVLPSWAWETHGLSGVWWSDRHDPMGLSAPRGVIRPESVAEWTVSPGMDEDEDEDEQEDFD